MTPSNGLKTMDAEHFIAHRGWQSRYPENTLLAVEAAIDVGARYVEIDVQLSSDRVPHLFHDATLRRVSRQPGTVSDYTAEDLAEFCAGETRRFGQRFSGTALIPLERIVELFERHPHVHLFVEVKAEATEHFGSRIVHEAIAPVLAPIRKRCTLISFVHEYLKHARGQGWARVGPVLHAWKELHSDAVASLDPVVVFADRKLLPRGDLSATPWPLAVYEVDDSYKARALLDRGVRWIETFAIGEMLREQA